MEIQVQVPITGSKEAIWKVITDIEHAQENISGIEKVEVLEKPSEGLVGLKWIETRTLFGKTATETMWITEAVPYSHYKTRAENHGAIYLSEMRITEVGGETFLNMGFKSQAQNFGARVMSRLMGPLFKNATKKAMVRDLEDIKAVVEEGSANER